eukprot:5051010-Amphidinium_carterae.1
MQQKFCLLASCAVGLWRESRSHFNEISHTQLLWLEVLVCVGCASHNDALCALLRRARHIPTKALRAHKCQEGNKLAGKQTSSSPQQWLGLRQFHSAKRTCSTFMHETQQCYTMPNQNTDIGLFSFLYYITTRLWNEDAFSNMFS